jgi:flagellar biosynthesis protein FliQ
MSEQMVVHLIKETIWVAFLLAGPVLGVGLVVGLIVGVFQSVTQIHEMTLTFIPKIVAVALVILFMLPWMMQALLAFTRNMFRISAGLG